MKTKIIDNGRLSAMLLSNLVQMQITKQEDSLINQINKKEGIRDAKMENFKRAEAL